MSVIILPLILLCWSSSEGLTYCSRRSFETYLTSSKLLDDKFFMKFGQMRTCVDVCVFMFSQVLALPVWFTHSIFVRDVILTTTLPFEVKLKIWSRKSLNNWWSFKWSISTKLNHFYTEIPNLHFCTGQDKYDVFFSERKALWFIRHEKYDTIKSES